MMGRVPLTRTTFGQRAVIMSSSIFKAPPELYSDISGRSLRFLPLLMTGAARLTT
jgi:hypothetical protein